jgi:DinB superfamily
MNRSQLYPIPEYFDRYINLCDDVEIIQAIQISIDELNNAPLDKWIALKNKSYAPGKWTVKDILQHLIDAERVFSYRSLAFARGESQPLPSFDEDGYAANADANNRSIEELVAELKLSHRSVMQMYKSFTPQMLLKKGMGFKGEYSVTSIGFIIPGHQRWHLKVIEEKYLPLI